MIDEPSFDIPALCLLFEAWLLYLKGRGEPLISLIELILKSFGRQVFFTQKVSKIPTISFSEIRKNQRNQWFNEP
ncbi:MAG: hypothetical protein MUF13_00315 [Akkermansiaceae bacterium]|nr:hypothetical protein [Akkermansiaceae bacterium]